MRMASFNENWDSKQKYKTQRPSGLYKYPCMVGWLAVVHTIRDDLGSIPRIEKWKHHTHG
jgi:hypothetical protein